MLGVSFMAAMTVLVIALRNVLPLLFLGWEGAHSQTVALTATLLLLGASFSIADGTQTVAAGALRGLNDTRVPLAFAALSFWLIGFTACWVFGFTLGLGPYGIWIGLSLGIALYAVLLTTRFHLITARGYLPAFAGTPPA
jgi:MATE family multidrug resistance protein